MAEEFPMATAELSRQLQHQTADDDDIKPVWPTWAVGALFRIVRRIQLKMAEEFPMATAEISGQSTAKYGKGVSNRCG
jgi:hypothetical protein